MTERPKSSPGSASAKESIVLVIDDDVSVRRGLTNLFESIGLKVEVFASAPEMLDSKLGRGIEGDVGCTSRHTRDFLCDPEICWCGRVCRRPKPNSVIDTATIDIVQWL